jgi:hypothetical protein
MHSVVTPYLLLIASEDNKLLVEKKKTICTLFGTIKRKPNIKIVFIATSLGSTVASLQHKA